MPINKPLNWSFGRSCRTSRGITIIASHEVHQRAKVPAVVAVFLSASRFAFLLFLLVSANVVACSFPPGSELFRFSETELFGTGEVPDVPRISIKSIERGFDDGDFASCSDAGTLTLVVDNYNIRGGSGYQFRLKSGSLGDATFSEYILVPIELDVGVFGFRIVWLDWVDGQRTVERINAVLGVRAVSATGVESTEILVRVRHPGG